jgi:glycosyltransferase involved in cell wall biosynthesis
MRSFTAALATGRRPFVTLHGAGTVPSDPRGYRQVRQAVRMVIPHLARAAISAAPDVPGWRFLPHASPRLASLGRLPFPPAGQIPTFAWVGRVDEGKPGDEFVEVLAALGRRRAVAGVVVGSGNGLARMEALAQRAGAPVQFVGEQDPEPFLARSWALVLFSRHEAVSFVAQEAMWAGRAVVASPLPGLRWLIGTTEPLVEDANQATAVLEDLCDPIRARARGDAAAERVRGLLTPDDPWPAVAAMYRDHTA